MLWRGVVVWLLVAALAVQVVALYSPGSPDPGPDIFPHADKVVHFLLFAVPAHLVARISTARWPLLLLALHGPVSEVVQHLWIPYRGGDPLDALADLAGVAAGAGLARLRSRATSP